jgi:arsenical pump membrane protein
VDRTAANLQAMVPALLFLCAGVPLAALLDRLGLFDAVAVEIERRRSTVPIAALWVLAAATTAVLNLDTTVVLLTPLAIRLARRAGADPLPVAAIPLLLASFASSFLPVSNLTTLIAVERFDLSVGDVVAHLALPGLAACVVGWLAYRRRHPTVLRSGAPGPRDPRTLAIGGSVVAGLLAGFVIGPSFGIDPWVVAVAADAFLVVVTRSVPWRDVPILTAAGVAAVAAFVSLALPADLLSGVLTATAPAASGGTVLAGAAAANAVNNLPALLVALDGVHQMTWGMWAWLAGVNTGAALAPIGALANLLWWRIVRDEGVEVSLPSYLRTTVPVVVPALLAAAVVLAAEAVVMSS